MAIIEVENVGKRYRTKRGGRVLLGRGGLGSMLRGHRTQMFDALKDITFSVDAGESLGIIGANGSGKSTLLKILAGVTIPTTGRVIVHGRVASLLELGAGFHPMLTGRENVYLNAGLLGMRHAQVDAQFDEIVEFSGIGDFIDNPVDTYSSGMHVRIGFAVAAFVNPDIFLVDEVLAVGDEAFQRKCRQKIGELREQGKTIVFVSHDLGTVSAICGRVILLRKGRMITRDSPRETINFYLRQVGAEASIHEFSAGAIDVIVCDGRVSVFHKRKEVSAPAGFQVQVQSMQRWHLSMEADWEIVERHPDGCKARGRMPRLPLTHVWDLRIEDGSVKWTVSMECEENVSAEGIEVNLFLPTRYTDWTYGDLSGAFPELAPSDLTWTPIVSPDLACTEAGALPASGEEALAPVLALVTERKPYARVQWTNSDYVTGCRVLQVGGRVPDVDSPLQKGVHHFATIEIRFQSTAAELLARAQARREERTLTAGGLSAFFERGAVRFSYEDQPLTSDPHFYNSISIGHLWDDGPNLQWASAEKRANRIEVSGESRRFPYRLHWGLEAVAGGIAVDIAIEALEAFDVEEYHASLCLRPEYSRWETAHESGAFPDFDPSQDDWRHVNREYAAGTWAKALSSSLPSVMFEVTSREAPFRMTAINTGYHQNARVLQALRVPEAGPLHLTPGRHPYFRGIVCAGSEVEA